MKAVRRAWLMWLVLGILAGVGQTVRAQEPPSQTSAPTDASASSDSAKPASANAAGPVAETPQAEKEKDDTEPLRHSASVRFLAQRFGGNIEMAYWVSVLLNFAVIVGVVFWAGRKYLPSWFSNRTAAIQKAMQEAQKASEEARRKLAEIESRLMKLDGEIGQMRDAAEREAAAEEVRIVAATEQEARKIAASAGQEIDAAAKAARRELVALAADLAVGLASKQIRVDQVTDESLVGSFARQLDGASDVPKGGR